MKKVVLPSLCLKSFGRGEYSPKYDLSMSLSIFWTRWKPSRFNSNTRRTCLFVILETSIYCKSFAAWGWGSASATLMKPYRFLFTSHLRKLSETRIGIISSSRERSEFYGENEESFRLWRGRAENVSARIRFCLCGDTKDEEIGFKEMNRCMMPRE